MKVLVISDSHGANSGIEEALSLHTDAKHVLFLGDGFRSVSDLAFCYPEREFLLLAGNCDFGADAPHEALWVINGYRIFACHGHTQMVKYGPGAAIQRAKTEKAQVLLYGHTHEAYCGYEDGLYVMNPGSISQPRASSKKSYGLLELSEKGILCSIAEL